MVLAPFTHLRNLKNWVESYAHKPSALWALGLIAFVEASFFPIPPDVLLIAIAGLHPRVAIWAASVCTLGSVLGGVLGYGIGYLFMESFGNSIVEFYHAQEVWKHIVAAYQGEQGLWFLMGAAFSPIPYKVATIAAGATEMPVAPFVGISILGRGLRFFAVGSLIYFLGPRVKIWIDRYFEVLSLAFFGLLVLGFLVIKFLLP